jgi:hypothetical protein
MDNESSTDLMTCLTVVAISISSVGRWREMLAEMPGDEFETGQQNRNLIMAMAPRPVAEPEIRCRLDR